MGQRGATAPEADAIPWIVRRHSYIGEYFTELMNRTGDFTRGTGYLFINVN